MTTLADSTVQTDELQAIRDRDAAGAETWFTGPASFTAQGARDRRWLLAKLDETVREYSEAKMALWRELVAGPLAMVVNVIGADVAEGLQGLDESVAQVLRLPQLEQVAVWQGTIAPDDFADELFHLGRLYGWAHLCVEANGPGLVTNMRLGKDLFYPNLYRRQTLDNTSKKYEKKFGWYTNRGNNSDGAVGSSRSSRSGAGRSSGSARRAARRRPGRPGTCRCRRRRR